MSDTGTTLEQAGWRQGAIVREQDVGPLLDGQQARGSTQGNDEQRIVIVASHSCDIANNNLASDPRTELVIAREIAQPNGYFTYNKNPRILHATLLICTENADIKAELWVELKAYEKVAVKKEHLAELTPDPNRVLANKQLEGYVSWLSARYSRPALPTEFNNRVASSKNKLRKKAKTVNEQLLGIYVEICPDKDIPKNEIYRVNLLGLVAADFKGSLNPVESTLESYADIMRDVGMGVTAKVKREDEVSIAHLKRFKRFYYDDLSLKNDTPLPPEWH